MLDLRHDALVHTNGRLGMLFAQTEIEVVELIGPLCSDIESVELCSDIEVLELSADVEVII